MKILSWAGAVIVAVAAGAFVFSAGSEAAEGDEALSLVEEYSYPGAAQILEEQDLKLIGGDGHILFTSRIDINSGVQCGTAEIQVEQIVDVDPFGWMYCFKTIGATGLLTLEVPGTFGVRAGTTPVEATAETPEGTKTYDVPANQPVPIYPGSGSDLPEAVLVELRLA